MTSLNVLTVRGCGMNGTLPDQGRVFNLFIYLFFTMTLLQIITIVEPNK